MVNMRAEITVRMYMACNIASKLIKQSRKSLHATILTIRHKACTIRSNSYSCSMKTQLVCCATDAMSISHGDTHH